jgi:hypothetical protein
MNTPAFRNVWLHITVVEDQPIAQPLVAYRAAAVEVG